LWVFYSVADRINPNPLCFSSDSANPIGQEARMRILTLFFVGCFITICAAQMPAFHTQQQSQEQPQVPKTIHQLFVEDKKDTHNKIAKFSEKELTAHGKAREAKIKTLLMANELKTNEDFHETAFI